MTIIKNCGFNRIFSAMKYIFTSAIVLSLLQVSAQISITSSHLPDDYDTLITRNATLLTDVDLEETGENHIWNFGFDILDPLALNAGVPCYTLSDLSLIDQAVFNNPFYEEYNSDFGLGFTQADLGIVTFDDSYQIYKNSGGVYAITGVISTINSIPLVAQMDDRDVIYDLPLTFGTNGSSDSQLEFEIPTIGFYGLDQTRSYSCDGWGTINIWDLSFDVLRVRSVVNATDSIYVEFLGGGISFPRPETITYEWLSTEYNVPILRITTNGGIITQVQTADIYQDPNHISKQDNISVSIYPNPTTESFRVLGLGGQSMDFNLYDQLGALVRNGKVNSTEIVSVENLPAGVYTLRLANEISSYEQKLIVK